MGPFDLGLARLNEFTTSCLINTQKLGLILMQSDFGWAYKYPLYNNIRSKAQSSASAGSNHSF